MATVEITQRALADLERLFDFIAAENPKKAREQILSVRKALSSWSIILYLDDLKQSPEKMIQILDEAKTQSIDRCGRMLADLSKQS